MAPLGKHWKVRTVSLARSRMLLALVVSSLIASGFILTNLGSHRTEAAPPLPPPFGEDRPEPALKGTFTYAIETYMNPRTFTGPAFAGGENRVQTTRWVSVNSDGVAERYLSLTVTPDGTPWQEESFDGQVRHLTFYDRQGDGASCTESGPWTVRGSTLPVLTAAEIERAGFTATTEFPAEVSSFADEFPGETIIFTREGLAGDRSRITDPVSYLVWSPSGQNLGEWNYGTIDGDRLLTDSYSVSAMVSVKDVPSASMPLASCGAQGDSAELSTRGGRPSDNLSPAPTPEPVSDVGEK